MNLLNLNKLYYAILIVILVTTLLSLTYNNYPKHEEGMRDNASENLNNKPAYEQLLEDQKNRLNNSSKKYDSREEEPPVTATGNHTIKIVFVKPLHITSNEIEPLYKILTSNNYDFYQNCSQDLCQQVTSLNYIKTFFEKEAKRYDVNNFNINLEFSDIKDINTLGHIGDTNYNWNKDPFSFNYFFETFENLLDPSNTKSLVLFLYFDESYVEPNENIESFYEYKKFRSFTATNKKRAYVNIYDFTTESVNSIVEVALHETLHLFGANDKYIEGERGCYNNGYGAPQKKPLFPQTTGDIMCLYVATSPQKYYRGSLSDENLVINQYTAQEIGW